MLLLLRSPQQARANLEKLLCHFDVLPGSRILTHAGVDHTCTGTGCACQARFWILDDEPSTASGNSRNPGTSTPQKYRHEMTFQYVFLRSRWLEIFDEVIRFL